MKKKEGLAGWMKEKWLNQRGEVGYTYKHDIYRPTVKISKDTPTTFKALTDKQIEKTARRKSKNW